jgi:hypothetical protein
MKNVVFAPLFFLFCMLACKKENPTEPTMDCELKNFPSIEFNGTLYVSATNSLTTFKNLQAAADYCDALVVQNCDSWSLSSKDELNAIYLNRSVVGIATSGSFWSSTRDGEYHGWIQDFTNGQQTIGLQYPYPAPGHHCICVRR